MSQVKCVPRDSIWYGSPTGGEWMKVREPSLALERVQRFLATTTFEHWSQIELSIAMAPTPALIDLEGSRDRENAHLRPPERWGLTFDRAALVARGIEVDDVLQDAIERFGAPAYHHWCHSETNLSINRMKFYWRERDCALRPEWLAFCETHRQITLHEAPRVGLSLQANSLHLRDPKTGAKLPFQGEAHAPPFTSSPAWPTDSSVWLYLPECRMALRARLPFERVGAAFTRYRTALDKMFGYKLSPKHYRALLINKQGTRAYDRKLNLTS